jgi:hypothetical protein
MLKLVQKGSAKFLFVLLLSTPLFAQIPQNISKIIQKKQLYYHPVWQKLLHYRQGKSEIDDPAFFFSKRGKRNLESELNATVLALLEDKSDDENSTLCYYPSRSTWLLEQIPLLKKKIKIPQCTKLKKSIQMLDAKQITIILASAHINSPASAFGHTFLRIDANQHTPLLSYAINYAAQTTEDNGFIYAYQGLFGGYKGLYSVDPYSKKLKTYSDLEQRDIWEYPLKLNQEEIDRLILHVLELQHFYADYFFLTENCSYNLLWLLEVAKPELALTSQFSLKAIPIDTLRAIGDAGLIKSIHYRPSKRKKILQLNEEIEGNPIAINFAKSKEYNLTLIKDLSPKQQAKTLELATHLLQIRHKEGEIDKREYLNHFLRLLKERSKLGKFPQPSIPSPTPPKRGHDSTKFTLSYAKNKELSTRIKIAYHDIYDNESGYISGAYINFLDSAIGYHHNKFFLEEINLLDIRSYAIQDAIFKPISWQVATGARRIFDNRLNAYLQAGGGITLGEPHLFGFLTLTPTLYYRDQDQWSIATNTGIIYNPSQKLKIGILAKDEWFTQNREIQEIDPFITYTLTKEHALKIQYHYQKQNHKRQKDIKLDWFWYF